MESKPTAPEFSSPAPQGYPPPRGPNAEPEVSAKYNGHAENADYNPGYQKGPPTSQQMYATNYPYSGSNQHPGIQQQYRYSNPQGYPAFDSNSQLNQGGVQQSQQRQGSRMEDYTPHRMPHPQMAGQMPMLNSLLQTGQQQQVSPQQSMVSQQPTAQGSAAGGPTAGFYDYRPGQKPSTQQGYGPPQQQWPQRNANLMQSHQMDPYMTQQRMAMHQQRPQYGQGYYGPPQQYPSGPQQIGPGGPYPPQHGYPSQAQHPQQGPLQQPQQITAPPRSSAPAATHHTPLATPPRPSSTQVAPDEPPQLSPPIPTSTASGGNTPTSADLTSSTIQNRPHTGDSDGAGSGPPVLEQQAEADSQNVPPNQVVSGQQPPADSGDSSQSQSQTPMPRLEPAETSSPTTSLSKPASQQGPPPAQQQQQSRMYPPSSTVPRSGYGTSPYPQQPSVPSPAAGNVAPAPAQHLSPGSGAHRQSPASVGAYQRLPSPSPTQRSGLSPAMQQAMSPALQQQQQSMYGTYGAGGKPGVMQGNWNPSYGPQGPTQPGAFNRQGFPQAAAVSAAYPVPPQQQQHRSMSAYDSAFHSQSQAASSYGYTASGMATQGPQQQQPQPQQQHPMYHHSAQAQYPQQGPYGAQGASSYFGPNTSQADMVQQRIMSPHPQQQQPPPQQTAHGVEMTHDSAAAAGAFDQRRQMLPPPSSQAWREDQPQQYPNQAGPLPVSQPHHPSYPPAVSRTAYYHPDQSHHMLPDQSIIASSASANPNAYFSPSSSKPTASSLGQSQSLNQPPITTQSSGSADVTVSASTAGNKHFQQDQQPPSQAHPTGSPTKQSKSSPSTQSKMPMGPPPIPSSNQNGPPQQPAPTVNGTFDQQQMSPSKPPSDMSSNGSTTSTGYTVHHHQQHSTAGGGRGEEFENVSSPSWPGTPKPSNVGQCEAISRMYDMGTEPDRRPFLTQLSQFLDENNVALNHVPSVNKKPVDFFTLFNAVKERGGYEEVHKQKKWKEIANNLCVAQSNSAGYTLRKNYKNYLLKYECSLTGRDHDSIIARTKGPSGPKKDGSGSSKKGAAAREDDVFRSPHPPPDSFGPGPYGMVMGPQGQPIPPGYGHQQMGMGPDIYSSQYGGYAVRPGGYPGQHQSQYQPGAYQQPHSGMPPQQQVPVSYGSGGMRQGMMNQPDRLPPPQSGEMYNQPQYYSQQQAQQQRMAGYGPQPMPQQAGPMGPHPMSSGSSAMPTGATYDQFGAMMSTAPPQQPGQQPQVQHHQQQPVPNARGVYLAGQAQEHIQAQQQQHQQQQQQQQQHHQQQQQSRIGFPPNVSTGPPPEMMNAPGQPGMMPPQYHAQSSQQTKIGQAMEHSAMPPGHPELNRVIGTPQPPSSGVGYPPPPHQVPDGSPLPPHVYQNRPQSASPYLRTDVRSPFVPPHRYPQPPPPASQAAIPSATTQIRSMSRMPSGSTAGLSSHAAPSSTLPTYPSSHQAVLSRRDLFPPNCVESTQPKLAKRTRLSHKDLGPVDLWKVYMSLRSGLLAETTWALDSLLILLKDEATIPFFNLASLPGLLQVLTDIFKRSLIEIFDEFSDLESKLPIEEDTRGADLSLKPKVDKSEINSAAEHPKSSVNIAQSDDESLLSLVSKELRRLKNGPKSTITCNGPVGGNHKAVKIPSALVAAAMMQTNNNVRLDYKAAENIIQKIGEINWDSGAVSSQEKPKLGGWDTTHFVNNFDSVNNKKTGFFNDEVTDILKQANTEEDLKPDMSKIVRGVSKICNKPSRSLKRRLIESGDIEEDLYCYDPGAVELTNSGEQQLANRCLCVSTIIRNLSFIPDNDRHFAKDYTLLLLMGRLLLLRVRLARKRHDTKPSRSVEEIISDKADDLDNEKQQQKSNALSKSTHPSDPPWLLRLLTALRENTLVSLANTCSRVQLCDIPEEACMPVLQGLIYWVTCLSPVAIDRFSTVGNVSGISPLRMAIEALCRMTIQDSNVDIILATPPFERIVKLFVVLVRLFSADREQSVREFALVLISSLVQNNPIAARVLALQKPCPVGLLLTFLEIAEQNATQIVRQQGIDTLRDNPELMGTSLDMLLRAANTIKWISQVPDNYSVMCDFEERLLSVTMSQLMDRRVATTIADALFEFSKNSLPRYLEKDSEKSKSDQHFSNSRILSVR